MMKILTKLSDHELLEHLKSGSVPAFEEIFNRYWKRLYTYACKVSENEVLCEDMIQEIFIRL